MAETIAIVTTLRDSAKILESFITYHLAIGFDHLFLFFDDPHDPSIEEARQHPGVTVIPHDASLERRWTTRITYGKMARFIHDHVMARQILNAEIAIELATRRGMDWLLHIDVDELFYSPGENLKDHLASLTARRISYITYPNHEAVPEKADVGDYFREVTLFNRNICTLSPEERRARRSFLFYGGGKSATRLCNGVLPHGVHYFRLPAQRHWLNRYFRRLFRGRRAPLEPTRREKLHGWFKRKLRSSVADAAVRPAILHFPCCGFEHFRTKYATLGPFPDKWFGSDEISNRIPFHLEARDVFMNPDRQVARKFYEERIMVRDAKEIRNHLANGSFCRIPEPSRLLAEAIPRTTEGTDNVDLPQ